MSEQVKTKIYLQLLGTINFASHISCCSGTKYWVIKGHITCAHLQMYAHLYKQAFIKVGKVLHGTGICPFQKWQ